MTQVAATPDSMEAAFRRDTVAGQLSEQLCGLIERGKWKYGDRLPSVRQLAQQFQVSISSVQEALRLLAEDDVLLLRPRQGSYVKQHAHGKDGDATGDRATEGYEIGIIRPLDPIEGVDEDQHWGGAIIHAFERQLISAGVHVVMLSYVPGAGDVQGQVRRRLEQCQNRVAAAVALPGAWDQKHARLCEEQSIRVVSINAPPRRSMHNFVAADNLEGGRRIGRCLGELGRRRVLCLLKSWTEGTSDKEKTLGLYEGLLDADCATDGVAVRPCGGWHDGDGYKATAAYLRQIKAAAGAMPEVIFTTGDLLALGAVRACREFGLKVPEDVGVIGTTGMQAAAYTDPPLTVLAQPMEQMGQAAGEMVLAMIRTGQTHLPGRRIPSPLIVRQSMPIPADIQRRVEAEYQAELDTMEPRKVEKLAAG